MNGIRVKISAFCENGDISDVICRQTLHQKTCTARHRKP